MRARDTRRRADRQGYAMLAACGLVIGLVGAAVAVTRPAARDPDTGCLKTGVARHHLVILDRTDPVTPAQQSLITAALKSLSRQVTKDERLTLLSFTGEAKAPEPVFDRCHPGAGESVNPLVETARRVDEAYRTRFADPLAAAIDGLSATGHAPHTHLVGMLATLANLTRYRGAAGETRWVLISDLVEHTPALSLTPKAKSAPTPARFAAYVREGLGGRLAGQRLEVLFIASRNGAHDARVKALWAEAFAGINIKLSIKEL